MSTFFSYGNKTPDKKNLPWFNTTDFQWYTYNEELEAWIPVHPSGGWMQLGGAGGFKPSREDIMKTTIRMFILWVIFGWFMLPSWALLNGWFWVINEPGARDDMNRDFRRWMLNR